MYNTKNNKNIFWFLNFYDKKQKAHIILKKKNATTMNEQCSTKL